MRRVISTFAIGLLAGTMMSACSQAQDAKSGRPPAQPPAPAPVPLQAQPATTPPAASPTAAGGSPAPGPASLPAPDQHGGQALSLQTVNGAAYAPPPAGPASADEAAASKAASASLIRAEVLLDRANFSPGVIDGRMGENVKNALIAYQKANGLPSDGALSLQTWQALTQRDPGPVLKTYVLSGDDVAGPWAPSVGEDFVKMSQQATMGYTSPLEMLSERFHMDQALLTALNPDADLTKAGTPITVVDPGAASLPPVASINVDKHTKSVTALDASGKVLAVFPATVGSTERPSPVGSWKVKGVAQNPDYLYDPSKLTWGPKRHGKLHIPPGPNGPVGVVWIALTAPDYGIHGTPDPHLVGKTASHGCVRLTNWDAEELSKAVRPGVKVTFAS